MRKIMFFTIAMFCGGIALAQDKITLKTSVDEGRQTQFHSIQTTATKIETHINGQVSDKKDSTEQETLQGTQTLLSVKDGEPTAAKFEFDNSCGSATTEPSQNAQQEKYPFAGKTVTLRRLPGDAVSDDFSQTLTADQRETLHGLLIPDSSDYPDHPVAIGESWDTTAANAKHMHLGANDSLASYCRLDWVKDVGGRKTAQLSMSVAIVRHLEDFIIEEQQGTGKELIDLATGTIVSGELSGPTKYSGSQKVTGGDGKELQISVTGSGSVIYKFYNAPAGWASTQPVAE